VSTSDAFGRIVAPAAGSLSAADLKVSGKQAPAQRHGLGTVLAFVSAQAHAAVPISFARRIQ
jgi:hypothetical protein